MIVEPLSFFGHDVYIDGIGNFVHIDYRRRFVYLYDVTLSKNIWNSSDKLFIIHN